MPRKDNNKADVPVNTTQSGKAASSAVQNQESPGTKNVNISTENQSSKANHGSAPTQNSLKTKQDPKISSGPVTEKPINTAVQAASTSQQVPKNSPEDQSNKQNRTLALNSNKDEQKLGSFHRVHTHDTNRGAASAKESGESQLKPKGNIASQANKPNDTDVQKASTSQQKPKQGLSDEGHKPDINRHANEAIKQNSTPALNSKMERQKPDTLHRAHEPNRGPAPPKDSDEAQQNPKINTVPQASKPIIKDAQEPSTSQQNQRTHEPNKNTKVIPQNSKNIQQLPKPNNGPTQNSAKCRQMTKNPFSAERITDIIVRTINKNEQIQSQDRGCEAPGPDNSRQANQIDKPKDCPVQDPKENQQNPKSQPKAPSTNPTNRSVPAQSHQMKEPSNTPGPSGSNEHLIYHIPQNIFNREDLTNALHEAITKIWAQCKLSNFTIINHKIYHI